MSNPLTDLLPVYIESVNLGLMSILNRLNFFRVIPGTCSRGIFGVTKFLCGKYVRRYSPKDLHAMKRKRCWVWYTVVDSTGKSIHRNFPGKTLVYNITRYAQLRHIIHDENLTILSEFEVEDIEFYKNESAFNAGQKEQLESEVRNSLKGDPIIAVVRKNMTPPEQSGVGGNSVGDDRMDRAVNALCKCSQARNGADCRRTEFLTKSQAVRFAIAFLARSFLSHVAYEARKQYSFRSRMSYVTISDLLRASRNGKWKYIMSKKRSTHKRKPLHDLYTRKTWVFLQTLNAKVNRQLHGNKLATNCKHQELVLIDKVYNIKESDIIAACDEIMRMNPGTTIKLYKHSSGSSVRD